MGPERVRDRAAQRVADLGPGRDVVREGPADGDGQDGGDADEPGGEHGGAPSPSAICRPVGRAGGLGGSVDIVILPR